MEDGIQHYGDKIYKMENDHRYKVINSRMMMKRSVFGISVIKIEKKFYEENMTRISSQSVTLSLYGSLKCYSLAFVFSKILLKIE